LKRSARTVLDARLTTNAVGRGALERSARADAPTVSLGAILL
jgi:hypothetical protein